MNSLGYEIELDKINKVVRYTPQVTNTGWIVDEAKTVVVGSSVSLHAKKVSLGSVSNSIIAYTPAVEVLGLELMKSSTNPALVYAVQQVNSGELNTELEAAAVTTDTWKSYPIYDVAATTFNNGIAGHTESQKAVDESLPFELKTLLSYLEESTTSVAYTKAVYDLGVGTHSIESIAAQVVTNALAGHPASKVAVSVTLPFDMPVPVSNVNNIGVQGTANFGIGITDNLPLGMSEMVGTTELGHANYGNYKYSDGSIMCWIPLFYYRWGGADSPYAAKYGLNSCDVKSKHDFVDVAAANAAGYALHRAFYDEGQIKDGFFVDKYKCTNKSNKASSIKGWSPITVDEYNYVLSGISDFSNNSIVIAKTRGEDFFVSTIFIQRALSLLSMAHAQASTSKSACAWYDATGIANYPKGANNVLRDFNDTTVTYKATIGTNNPLTGTATPFAKTTHNGQTNGVADLNGIRSELVLGLTQLAGKYYVLKTSVKASELQKGVTLPTDAWGAKGIAANYELLGTKYESLTGSTLNKRMGNGDNQVFSSAVTGKGWQAACAGIPLLTGVSDESVDSSTVFGKDLFADIRIDNVYPLVGGSTSDKAIAGIWYTHLVIPFSDRGSHAFRSALYNA